MNKKLYVGNLQWSVTENDLRMSFADVGDIVEVAIILNRDTGRSRGFGFVEMATEEDAQNAVETLDGVDLKGRPLVIREALPEKKKERSFRPGRDDY